MNYRDKQKIKKALFILLITLLAILGAMHFLNDADISKNGYSVQILDVQTDQISKSFSSDVIRGSAVEISVKNNVETNSFRVQAGVVYDDGSSTDVILNAKSHELNVDYYEGFLDTFTIYTGGTENVVLAFEEIDKSKNPKLVLTLISDVWTGSFKRQEYIIPLSTYME